MLPGAYRPPDSCVHDSQAKRWCEDVASSIDMSLMELKV